MLKTNLPVAKILIDFDKYLQVLKCKAIVNREENQPPSENVLEFLPQPTFVDQVELKKKL